MAKSKSKEPIPKGRIRLDVLPDVKTAFADIAWQQRKSEAQLARELITDFVLSQTKSQKS